MLCRSLSANPNISDSKVVSISISWVCAVAAAATSRDGLIVLGSSSVIDISIILSPYWVSVVSSATSSII